MARRTTPYKDAVNTRQNLDRAAPNDAPARREALRRLIGVGVSVGGGVFAGGCVPAGPASDADRVDRVYGRRGFGDGRFLKPRAITIDRDDNVFIVDTTGRIQVFDVDGTHLRTWSTPDTANGRPTGLGTRVVNGATRLLVADTHYYRVLSYTPDGRRIDDETIGGKSGIDPGQFAFVTDACDDGRGGVIVGEYNANDRLQRFGPDGGMVDLWGTTGDAPGQFLRPQGLVVRDDVLYVADSANHRIQRFDLTTSPPRLIDIWGGPGDGPGRFGYPYGIDFLPGGDLVVAEYRGARVQRLDTDGDPVASWGGPGRDVGQLNQPWGVAVDSTGRMHVLDSHNHRVQRVAPPGPPAI